MSVPSTVSNLHTRIYRHTCRDFRVFVSFFFLSSLNWPYDESCRRHLQKRKTNLIFHESNRIKKNNSYNKMRSFSITVCCSLQFSLTLFWLIGMTHASKITTFSPFFFFWFAINSLYSTILVFHFDCSCAVKNKTFFWFLFSIKLCMKFYVWIQFFTHRKWNLSKSIWP